MQWTVENNCSTVRTLSALPVRQAKLIYANKHFQHACTPHFQYFVFTAMKNIRNFLKQENVLEPIFILYIIPRYDINSIFWVLNYRNTQIMKSLWEHSVDGISAVASCQQVPAHCNSSWRQRSEHLGGEQKKYYTTT